MSAIDIVKFATTFVVSSGVSTMVGFAAKNSVPKVAPFLIQNRPMLVKGYHLFQKIAIPAGAAALAGMASEQAVKYTERQIDENVVIAENIKKKVEETLEKAKTDDKTEDKPETSEEK